MGVFSFSFPLTFLPAWFFPLKVDVSSVPEADYAASVVRMSLIVEEVACNLRQFRNFLISFSMVRGLTLRGRSMFCSSMLLLVSCQLLL